MFAFFNHSLRLGSGIDTVITELASRLAKHYSVTVFCFQTDYKKDEYNFDINVIRSSLTSTTNRMTALAPFLMDKIGTLTSQLEKYDIVNTHIFPANYIARNLRNPLRIVTDWTVGPPRLWSSSIKRRLYVQYLLYQGNKIAVQKADLVVSSSEFIRRWVQDNYHVIPTLLHIDGINFELLNRNISTPDKVFSSYPSVEGKQIILYVGRVTDHKNIQTLVESFSILKRKLRDIVLMIVGDYENYMPYYNKIVDLVKRRGLEEEVIFTGIIPWTDLPSYYSACHVYATCSLWEGFLRPESFAFGKPIVCFDVGPNAETVEDGKDGYLVKQIGAEPFSDALYKLLDNDRMRQEFGEYGYQWARKKLDFNLIAEEFRKLSEEHLARH